MSNLAGETPTLEEPQRQSRWAVIFLAFRAIRAVGAIQIAIAIGFVLAQSPPLLLLLLLVPLIAVVILGIATLSWWRYTFAVIDDELQVTKGILAQERLVVPLERIQSVSIEQKLLHRPIGLVQVSVDTAGTAAAEFTIDAIERPIAAALQQAAADNRASRLSRTIETSENGEVLTAGSRTNEEIVVLRHDPRRLVKVALTQMPLAGLAVFAPLIALGDELFGALPFDPPDVDGPSAGVWLLWAVPLAIASIGMILVLINLIRVMITEWNLTLTATPAGLRRDAGLLATTSKASSVPRVQRITTRQGLLQRSAGLHTVTLSTVGIGSLILPGCDDAQVGAIRGRVLDERHVQPDLVRRVSTKAIFKAVRNTTIFCVVIVLATVAFVKLWSLLAFVLVPLVWLPTRRSVRLRRWGVGTDSIVDRQELLSWTRQEMLFRKVNGVAIRQSLFERSRDLATLSLQSAEGSVSIGMISLEEARAVRDRALFIAETDSRAWM